MFECVVVACNFWLNINDDSRRQVNGVEYDVLEGDLERQPGRHLLSGRYSLRVEGVPRLA